MRDVWTEGYGILSSYFFTGSKLIIAIFLILCIRHVIKKRKDNTIKFNIRYNILLSLLITSMCIVFDFTVWSRWESRTVVWYVLFNKKIPANILAQRSLTLIPNNDIKEIIRYYKINGSFGILKDFILGNIIMFMPVGFFLATLVKKEKKFLFVTLYSCLFSIFIESLQYYNGCGSSDINDVIYNTIGGLLGGTIYIFGELVYKKIKILFVNRRCD